MIPYIVVLVFLIVMVLVQVYRIGEGFDATPTSAPTTETPKYYKDMEERIVKDIVKQLKDELFVKGVYVKRSNSLKNETTDSTEDTDTSKGNTVEKSLVKSILKDVRSQILPSYSNDGNASDMSDSDYAEIDHTEVDIADDVSNKYDKELKDRLVKSITKQLKDEMLLQRATTNLKDNTLANLATPYAATNMTQQGCEYKSGAPINMDDYIRKDSIPCYGCTLPA